jgi:hypothetical protein
MQSNAMKSFASNRPDANKLTIKSSNAFDSFDSRSADWDENGGESKGQSRKDERGGGCVVCIPNIKPMQLEIGRCGKGKRRQGKKKKEVKRMRSKSSLDKQIN